VEDPPFRFFDRFLCAFVRGIGRNIDAGDVGGRRLVTRVPLVGGCVEETVCATEGSMGVVWMVESSMAL